MKRIAVVHQPYFLPWIGYFARIGLATDYVILDNVQFRPRYYHNRTRVLNNRGEISWLTVPVNEASKRRFLSEIKISEHFRPNKLIESLRHYYGKYPHFETVMPCLSPILVMAQEKLISMDVKLIETLLIKLGYTELRVHRASELSSSLDPTERLIEVCQSIEAEGIIMGPDSMRVHNTERFVHEEIELVCIDAIGSHPVYSQGPEEFIAGLSVLDLVFRKGFENSRDLIDASQSTLLKAGM